MEAAAKTRSLIGNAAHAALDRPASGRSLGNAFQMPVICKPATITSKTTNRATATPKTPS
jgi:hypothetical protein